MKISQLKQIIKEEVATVLRENAVTKARTRMSELAEDGKARLIKIKKLMKDKGYAINGK